MLPGISYEHCKQYEVHKDALEMRWTLGVEQEEKKIYSFEGVCKKREVGGERGGK